jgi:hypothetical protein
MKDIGNNLAKKKIKNFHSLKLKVNQTLEIC